MDEEHPRDRPDVRHVPVSREDEVDAASAQQREHVASVEHLVPFAPGAGHGNEVVVADEDAQVGLAGETLLDPGVVLAADLPLVDVGLRGVDRDERDGEAAAVEPLAGVPRAEGVLVVEVADVAGVVVAGDAHDVRTGQGRELAPGDRVLVGVAVVGEIAGDDHEVRLGPVHLGDRGAEQFLAVPASADVNVGELCDQHGASFVA
jgi:hypothetical protein